MTTPKDLYIASTDQAQNAPPQSGFYSNRRPFSYENMFGSAVYKNQNKVFTTLDGGTDFELKTNANDNGSDRTIENFHHIMKSSSSSSPSYGKFYWNVQTNYYNMTGMGPFWGTSSSTWSYWHANVIGASFTWRKDQGAYDEGECGFKHWGLNYYSPSRNLWRTVRFNSKSSTGNHYYSNEGDDWVHHRGNPVAFGTTVNGWVGCRGLLSSGGRNKVTTEDWLWGGFYIIGECTNRGGVSRVRRLDLSDLQPVYSNPGNNARLIVPASSQEISDLRNSGRRLIC